MLLLSLLFLLLASVLSHGATTLSLRDPSGGGIPVWIEEEEAVTETNTPPTNLAIFDGSDYMRMATAAPGGLSDNSTVLTTSLWFRVDDGDGTERYLWSIWNDANTRRYSVTLTTDNKIFVFARNSAASTVASMTSTTTYVEGTGLWHHLLAPINTAATNDCMIIIDGTNVTDYSSFNIVENGQIDTLGTGWRYTVGASGTVTADKFFYGGLSTLYCTDEYAGTIADFFADHAPVDLGADGSTPTGTAAVWYCPGAANDFDLNPGTAIDFTITGSLD